MAATFAAYVPALDNDFLNYDDDRYITQNFVVRAGITVEGMLWATGFRVSNWHPLTWLSHMVDCQIWGVRPRGHHLTSVVLHAVNTALLFWVLHRLTGCLAAAAFAAALFGLHPTRTESVAWISERKDVLSLAFFLLTLRAYHAYASAPSTARYLAVVVFLALGLMAKPMLVSAPFVLLLLDYWPLGRLRIEELRAGIRRSTALRRLLLEKVPLILFCALSSWLTVLAQRAGGTIVSMEGIPLEQRIANAIVSYGRYLGRTVWPSELAIFHPFPIGGWPAWLVVANLALLTGVTLVALRLARSHAFGIVGWAWFLVTLVPVIGLVQVGAQSMADRYTYLPLIGLVVAFSFGVNDAARRRPRLRVPAVTGCAILLGALGVGTAHQLGHWRDSATVMRNALAVAERLEHRLGIRTHRMVPHLDLGAALVESGDYTEAEHHLRQALRFEPNNPLALNNVGRSLFLQKRLRESLQYFDRAIGADPDCAEAHSNKGAALASLGEFEDALVHFARAGSLDPNNPGYLANQGFTLHQLGRSREGIGLIEEALRREPGRALHWYRLGLIHEELGQFGTAVRMYETSLEQLGPTDRRALARQTRQRLKALRSSGAIERPPSF
jgi:Flp pilus assembly protein TadD